MSKTQIGAYYCPVYHRDKRNDKSHGKGWNEWRLMKAAKPRFEGHYQPKIPLWGYENEDDPKVMAKKVNAACEAGIDALIFDWYYYDDGPYLENALHNGFFGASNNEQISFAIMWANHNWVDIMPASRATAPQVMMRGSVSYETFIEVARLTVSEYFSRPNYWRVDGGLYYSIYEPDKLISGLGGYDATREALNEFRAKTREAGLGEINLNAVTWGLQILPGNKVEDHNALAERLGFNSISNYVWIHNEFPYDFPKTQYGEYALRAFELMKKSEKELKLPMYPNVTMGWDSTPRTVQTDNFDNLGYPYIGVLADNSPEEFEKALIMMRDWMNGKKSGNMFTINAWNEWTEGSYLEPDTVNQFGYLDAIRRVFKTAEA